MVAMWSLRSGVYKATVFCIYFVFCVYALAFAIPTWFGASKKIFQGLWMICTGDDTVDFDDCKERSFGDDFDWMDGARGVWIGGMFFYLAGVIYCTYENLCGSTTQKDYGVTGALVFLAGLCGAAGVIVIAIKIEEDYPDLDYFWGYMLACIASGLAIILAVVLLISRKPAYDAHPHKGNQQVPNQYINAGFNNYGPYDDMRGHHVPDMYPNAGHYPYAMYKGPAHNGMMMHPGSNMNPPVHQDIGYSHYRHDMTQPSQRYSYAESTDLSNGYTKELINVEHTLSRSNMGRRDDYGWN